jgi:hypothetical protein
MKKRGEVGALGFGLDAGFLCLVGVGLFFIISSAVSATPENPNWAGVFVLFLLGLGLCVYGILKLSGFTWSIKERLKAAVLFSVLLYRVISKKLGVALILIGVGLFLYGIVGSYSSSARSTLPSLPFGAGGRSRWPTEARLEAAIGAAVAVGGLLLYRARK